MPDDLVSFDTRVQLALLNDRLSKTDEQLKHAIAALAIERTAPSDDAGRREAALLARIDSLGLTFGRLLDNRDRILRASHPLPRAKAALVRRPWWKRLLNWK